MKTTNNNIQIFNNSNFGTIRTITNAEGETFFVGRDVATALGYSNTRDALNRHVDKEDRDGVVIHDSIGRQQKAVIINESGASRRRSSSTRAASTRSSSPRSWSRRGPSSTGSPPRCCRRSAARGATR